MEKINKYGWFVFWASCMFANLFFVFHLKFIPWGLISLLSVSASCWGIYFEYLKIKK